MNTLSKEELRRYDRHIILPEVGLEGQQKLKEGSVLLVGAGGLGSPLALYLAAAGVGRIGIVDFDVVDASNLQRQVLHGTSAVGRMKLESARARLEDLNPFTKLETFELRLSSENALDLFKDFDVIADGTDNFPTRYLVNDACVLSGKPNVYGSIFRFEGQLSVFCHGDGPCYRCLYREPPPPGMVPSCAEGGVFGVLPGVIGTLQANEVIKLLLGIGDVASGKLLLYDALAMSFRELTLRRSSSCPLCGDNPSIRELMDYEDFCGLKAPRDESASQKDELSVAELAQMMKEGRSPLLLDVREPYETEISRIEGALYFPLSTLQDHLEELDPEAAYVVFCKSGARSARAIEYLRARGFHKLKNLVGGINQWAREIDRELPTY